MSSKKILASVCLFLCAGTSLAATFDYQGVINTQKDVVYIPFTIASNSTNVRVWTDSYRNGLNFDPITSVWTATGDLLISNDDNASIAPGQTSYDSGLVFNQLAAGSYIFSVAAYNNFPNGSKLSEGFLFDQQAPIAIGSWCQPSTSCHVGPNFSVHLSGVDTVAPPALTAPVPEPSTYAMLLAGLAGITALTRRRKQ